MVRAATAVASLAVILACAGPRSSAPPSAAAPDAAPRADASAVPVKDTVKVADSQLICRMERPTGSNIPKRVCFTQDQLDAMRAAAGDAHRRATQQTHVSPTTPGGN